MPARPVRAWWPRPARWCVELSSLRVSLYQRGRERRCRHGILHAPVIQRLWRKLGQRLRDSSSSRASSFSRATRSSMPRAGQPRREIRPALPARCCRGPATFLQAEDHAMQAAGRLRPGCARPGRGSDSALAKNNGSSGRRISSPASAAPAGCVAISTKSCPARRAGPGRSGAAWRTGAAASPG